MNLAERIGDKKISTYVDTPPKYELKCIADLDPKKYLLTIRGNGDSVCLKLTREQLDQLSTDLICMQIDDTTDIKRQL